MAGRVDGENDAMARVEMSGECAWASFATRIGPRSRSQWCSSQVKGTYLGTSSGFDHGARANGRARLARGGSAHRLRGKAGDATRSGGEGGGGHSNRGVHRDGVTTVTEAEPAGAMQSRGKVRRASCEKDAAVESEVPKHALLAFGRLTAKKGMKNEIVDVAD